MANLAVFSIRDYGNEATVYANENSGGGSLKHTKTVADLATSAIHLRRTT